MNARTRFIVLVAASSLFPMAVRAQLDVRSCGDGTGVIQGVVVDAVTGAPVARAGVQLVRDTAILPRCFASTAADGTFLIHGRRPGIDTIKVGAWHFRRHQPLIVAVAEADTQRVRIEVRPGTVVDDCLEARACSDWLMAARDSAMSDDEAIQALVYKTAVVLAWKLVDQPFNAYVCLPDDVSQRVFAAVRASHTRTAPAAECKLTPAPDVAGRERVRHVPTGEPAYLLRMRVRGESSEQARVVELGHYVAPLWAEGWMCTFRRSTAGWNVSECRMAWIS